MSIDVEYAIKKDIRNNPVVREVDRHQKEEFLRMFGLAILVVAALLFAAWQHSKIVNNGYAVETLRKQLAEEDASNRKLKLEVEALRSPSLVEDRAGRELHMVAPSEKDTLVIQRARSSMPAKTVVAEVR